MTRFYLIRHGMNDTVGKRLAGRMDGIHLNEEGILQARKLVSRMSDVHLDAVYSSPLDRALETAEPLAQSKNIELIKSEHFLEIDFGKWTDLSFSQLERDPLFLQFNTNRSSTRIPGGETMVEAQIRFVTGIQRCMKDHDGGNVAIISHADMIKAALAWYMEINLDYISRFEISPASISILELFPETSRVLLVNDTGHIASW